MLASADHTEDRRIQGILSKQALPSVENMSELGVLPQIELDTPPPDTPGRRSRASAASTNDRVEPAAQTLFDQDQA